MSTVIPLSSTPSDDSIQFIKQCLDQGGVVAVPTDSFYGLAVNPFQEKGGQRLQELKGGRVDKPFPVLLGAVSQLDGLVREIPGSADLLIRKFWPGLLTIVVPAQIGVCSLITAGTGTIGVRQPDFPSLCQLLACVGPVTGTSANRSGKTPCRTPDEVREQLGEDVGYHP